MLALFSIGWFKENVLEKSQKKKHLQTNLPQNPQLTLKMLKEMNTIYIIRNILNIVCECLKFSLRNFMPSSEEPQTKKLNKSKTHVNCHIYRN